VCIQLNPTPRQKQDLPGRPAGFLVASGTVLHINS